MKKLQMKSMRLLEVYEELKKNPDKCYAVRPDSNPKSFIYMQTGSTIAASELRCHPVQLLRCNHPAYYLAIEPHVDMVTFTDLPENIEDYKENPQATITVGWKHTDDDLNATWLLHTVVEED